VTVCFEKYNILESTTHEIVHFVIPTFPCVLFKYIKESIFWGADNHSPTRRMQVEFRMASKNTDPLASLASCFFPFHWPFLYFWPVVFWLGEWTYWTTHQFGECLENLIHTPGTVKSGYSDSHRDHFFLSLYLDFTVSGRPVIVIFL
jgi:hypothetical protein